jgi:hypothetical protein
MLQMLTNNLPSTSLLMKNLGVDRADSAEMRGAILKINIAYVLKHVSI